MLTGPAFFSAAYVPVVTLNPSDKSANITLSGSNLTATKTAGGDASYASVRATLGRDAATDNGYFEFVLNSGTLSTFLLVGVSRAAMSTGVSVGSEANGWSYYEDDGQKFHNNVGTAYGASWKTDGDVIGVAISGGKIWFAKNGTWQASGNPAAGTNEAYSGLTGTVFPTCSLIRASAPASQMTGRFALASFSYAPPGGFGAWDR